MTIFVFLVNRTCIDEERGIALDVLEGRELAVRTRWHAWDASYSGLQFFFLAEWHLDAVALGATCLVAQTLGVVATVEAARNLPSPCRHMSPSRKTLRGRSCAAASAVSARYKRIREHDGVIPGERAAPEVLAEHNIQREKCPLTQITAQPAEKCRANRGPAVYSHQESTFRALGA
ncbi:hypothetical protein B0H10DRAFT_1941540 [Mycena sp. CBHHK59/15]|nr:hypothetical protein B0H10DRAFT_1941540 [Mycena sp. CBHHK59/15]